MACSSCGGRSAEPVEEVYYTDPQGKTVKVDSVTEAKIKVSMNSGGSYVVKKK